MTTETAQKLTKDILGCLELTSSGVVVLKPGVIRPSSDSQDDLTRVADILPSNYSRVGEFGAIGGMDALSYKDSQVKELGDRRVIYHIISQHYREESPKVVAITIPLPYLAGVSGLVPSSTTYLGAMVEPQKEELFEIANGLLPSFLAHSHEGIVTNEQERISKLEKILSFKPLESEIPNKRFYAHLPVRDESDGIHKYHTFSIFSPLHLLERLR